MDLPTRETVAEFADLVCADAQWVREEFDALIAASFGRPPGTPPPSPPTAPRRDRRAHPSAGQGHDHLPAFRPVGFREPGHRRQRSPPR